MKFTEGMLLWVCYTHRFTQKQNQPQDISIRSLVKLITLVTRTRQADKSRMNINLVISAEVKLHFVTKGSLLCLNHFWLRFLQHLFNNGIQIWESQQYYELSVKIYLAFRFPQVSLLTGIKWLFLKRVFQLNWNQ